jgi:hypothetical protein
MRTAIWKKPLQRGVLAHAVAVMALAAYLVFLKTIYYSKLKYNVKK